jgi:hypothetical protein
MRETDSKEDGAQGSKGQIRTAIYCVVAGGTKRLQDDQIQTTALMTTSKLDERRKKSTNF